MCPAALLDQVVEVTDGSEVAQLTATYLVIAALIAWGTAGTGAVHRLTRRLRQRRLAQA